MGMLIYRIETSYFKRTHFFSNTIMFSLYKPLVFSALCVFFISMLLPQTTPLLLGVVDPIINKVKINSNCTLKCTSSKEYINIIDDI